MEILPEIKVLYGSRILVFVNAHNSFKYKLLAYAIKIHNVMYLFQIPTNYSGPNSIWPGRYGSNKLDWIIFLRYSFLIFRLGYSYMWMTWSLPWNFHGNSFLQFIRLIGSYLWLVSWAKWRMRRKCCSSRKRVCLKFLMFISWVKDTYMLCISFR